MSHRFMRPKKDKARAYKYGAKAEMKQWDRGYGDLYTKQHGKSEGKKVLPSKSFGTFPAGHPREGKQWTCRKCSLVLDGKVCKKGHFKCTTRWAASNEDPSSPLFNCTNSQGRGNKSKGPRTKKVGVSFVFIISTRLLNHCILFL